MGALAAAVREQIPGEAQVLISGGGPSGLFLALDLAARGIASTVIEPRGSVDHTRPRAKTTNARTMTHLRRLGLADALRAAAPLPVDYAQDVIFCTRLAGPAAHELRRFRNAFQLVPGRYGPQPECGQQVPQPVLEEVLRAAAARNPLVTFVTGWSVLDVQELEGPDVQGAAAHGAAPLYAVVVADAAGSTVTIRSRYVVGADGGSSAVRRSLGIRLEGSSAALSNISILFRSKELGAAITLDSAVQYWVVGSEAAGMVGRMDLADTWWAIIQGVDPGKDVAPGDAAALVRSLVGAEVDVDVVATDPWTARMLLAPKYSRGNIFLVGDAAHLNPPWGGHGFNTCVGDAANLAWKLAGVIQGWANPRLLDSYGLERRPVAARTIRDAAANGKALAYHFADPRLADDGPDGQAARRSAHQALAVKQSEFDSLGLVLGYSYSDSPAVVPDGAPVPAEDPIRYVASATPGALLPHAWLQDSTSLYSRLGGGFTLMADDGTPLSELWGAPAVLVRPDQHVAWRGSSAEAAAAALTVAAGFAPAGYASAGASPQSTSFTSSQDEARSSYVDAVIP